MKVLILNCLTLADSLLNTLTQCAALLFELLGECDLQTS